MNFLSIKPLTMNIYALPGYRQTLSLVTWKKKTFVFLIILIDFIKYFITEWISTDRYGNGGVIFSLRIII